jgi:hypothetical protein
VKPHVYLAWCWVLITAGVLLAFETTQLPFTAGSPATDLLAPVSALACGIAAVVMAWKAVRGARKRPWLRALALLSLILALLVAGAAACLLAFVFLMCGIYWAGDTC